MPFKESKNEPWINQKNRSDSYGFDARAHLRFGNYPFRITEAGNNAPILTSATPQIDPNYKTEFDLNVNVAAGKVYDLSLTFPNIKMPLYITKRRDGSIVGVQGKQRITLEPEGWESMVVPVDIKTPYTLRIKTKGGIADVSEGSGMMFFECVFRDITTLVGTNSAKIRSASILTDLQLKKKYPGTTIDRTGAVLPQRWRNTVRTFIFYSPENCVFQCLNAARTSFPRGFPDPTTYSEELKRQLNVENVGGVGPYVFSLAIKASGWPTLKNDLFLRIS